MFLFAVSSTVLQKPMVRESSFNYDIIEFGISAFHFRHRLRGYVPAALLSHTFPMPVSLSPISSISMHRAMSLCVSVCRMEASKGGAKCFGRIVLTLLRTQHTALWPIRVIFVIFVSNSGGGDGGVYLFLFLPSFGVTFVEPENPPLSRSEKHPLPHAVGDRLTEAHRRCHDWTRLARKGEK